VAEIKSTMDLVMERTKNLTLSSAERQAQKQLEMENRIKGLAQKLEDGLLTNSQLEIEYESLKKESDLPDNSLLVREILTRLDPNLDNQILLEALEQCCRLDTTAIRANIKDYREAYHRTARVRSTQLKEDLAQSHSISGTAVLPNLDADEQWQKETQNMRRQFEDRLNRAYGMSNVDGSATGGSN
jgi:hypothetical protein